MDTLNGGSNNNINNKILLPILLVPGFMSSALEVVKSDTTKRWEGERLWLKLHKLGFSGKLFGTLTTIETGDSDDEDESTPEVLMKNDWLRHVALAPDLIHEKAGIQVRACTGLRAVDYMADNELIKSHSYVFGPLINALKRNGYVENVNLDAVPYDWRIPPQELEARDSYFSNTIQRIEQMYADNNNRPVILICHSMGAKTGTYLVHFAASTMGQHWVDKYLFKLILCGPPTLGASVSLQRFVVGDRMGLPATFLRQQDALIMGRSFGSACWLLPNERDGSSSSSVTENLFYVRKESVFLVQPRTLDLSGLQIRLHAKDKPTTVIWDSIIKLKIMIEYEGSAFTSTWFRPSLFQDSLVVSLWSVVNGVDLTDPKYEFVEFPGPHNLKRGLNDMMTITVIGRHITALQNAIYSARSTNNPTKWYTVIKSAAYRTFEKASATFESVKGVVLATKTIHLETLLSPDTSNNTPDPSIQIKSVGKLRFDRKRFELMVCEEDGGNGDRIHHCNTSRSNEEGCDAPVTGFPNEYFNVSVSMPIRSNIHRVNLDGEMKFEFLISWRKYKDISDRVAACSVYTKDVDTLVKSLEYTGFRLQSTREMMWREELWRALSLWKLYSQDPCVSSSAPPIRRVAALYGVNLKTPVGSVYRRNLIVNSNRRTQFIAQHRIDEESKLPEYVLARRSHTFQNGIIYETSHTVQTDPITGDGIRVSGDGTVPYFSLAYVKTWANSCDLQVYEMDGVEHRAMLNNTDFHNTILSNVIFSKEAWEAVKSETVKQVHRLTLCRMSSHSSGGEKRRNSRGNSISDSLNLDDSPGVAASVPARPSPHFECTQVTFPTSEISSDRKPPPPAIPGKRPVSRKLDPVLPPHDTITGHEDGVKNRGTEETNSNVVGQSDCEHSSPGKLPALPPKPSSRPVPHFNTMSLQQSVPPHPTSSAPYVPSHPTPTTPTEPPHPTSSASNVPSHPTPATPTEPPHPTSSAPNVPSHPTPATPTEPPHPTSSSPNVPSHPTPATPTEPPHPTSSTQKVPPQATRSPQRVPARPRSSSHADLPQRTTSPRPQPHPSSSSQFSPYPTSASAPVSPQSATTPPAQVSPRSLTPPPPLPPRPSHT